MNLKLNTWGNSLGLRIPKIIRETLNLNEGSRVDIALDKGKMIITPLTNFKRMQNMSTDIDLEEQVKQITAKNRHNINDEEPLGQETW